MHCKSFSKYSVMENVVEDIAKSSELKIEDFFSSFILLSIKKSTQDIGATKGVIEVWSLREYLRPQS